MENNIKDYLHLYLGCEVLQTGIIYNLIGLMPYRAKFKNPSDEIRLIVKSKENDYDEFPLDEYVKLILRPLSDATEEENIQAIKAVLLHTDTWVGGAFRTAYLLSKHFDLFGLIEAGLAIDKTTLKQ